MLFYVVTLRWWRCRLIALRSRYVAFTFTVVTAVTDFTRCYVCYVCSFDCGCTFYGYAVTRLDLRCYVYVGYFERYVVRYVAFTLLRFVDLLLRCVYATTVTVDSRITVYLLLLFPVVGYVVHVTFYVWLRLPVCCVGYPSYVAYCVARLRFAFAVTLVTGCTFVTHAFPGLPHHALFTFCLRLLRLRPSCWLFVAFTHTRLRLRYWIFGYAAGLRYRTFTCGWLQLRCYGCTFVPRYPHPWFATRSLLHLVPYRADCRFPTLPARITF